MKNFNQKLVNWSKKIDFVLKIIFGRLVQKSKFEFKPKKIIIFDFHLIGDIVILTPFLINLRKQNPNSYIALVAGPWAKVVLENHPQLYDAFYPVETPWVKGQYSIQSLIKIFQLILFLRSKSWDWGIEVRGDLRQIIMLYFTGAKRRIGYDFTGGGWLLTDVVPDQASIHHLLTHHRQNFDYLHPEAQDIDFTPQLWLSPQEQYEVDQTVKCIGLHLGASLPLRMLSKTKAFELLGLLLEKFLETILLFEIPENKELPNRLYDNLSPSQKKRVRLQSFSLRENLLLKQLNALYL